MSVIKKQSILNSIYSYLGAGIGIITQGFIIPNYFTPEENGLLALLLSYMFIFCQIASLGFNNAGTKYFSFFRNYQTNHRGYLNLGFKTQLLGYIGGVCVLWLLKDYIIQTNSNGNELFAENFNFIFVMASATMIFNLFDNYLKGLYNTSAGTLYSQFFQRLFLLIAVSIYALKLVDFHQFIYLWIVAISLPTLFIIIKALSVSGLNFLPSKDFPTSHIRPRFIKFASFSIFTGLSSMIVLQLDKIMVYKYLGLGNTGIYNTCLLFASLLGMAYVGIHKASSAIVIDAMEKEEYNKVESIYKKSSINLYIFGLFIMLIVWVNIDQLFGFIKPEYSIGKTALIIIGFSKLFDLLTGINSLILANSKYYKIDSVLIISFVFVLYLLNQWLIPIYKLNGAAVASLLAIIYYNTLRSLLVWHYFKIQPLGQEQLIATIISGLVVYIGFMLPTLESPAISIIYKSFITGFLFLGLIYFFQVSKDINTLFIQILTKMTDIINGKS
ncbi:polysaccharide biosynthesis C-terminal domain-containing protein [uncultured Arcticibacterium sp.]|uniref:lipopolysaccharide biosynthesis protein n=1 Tax=uncultured Arcticibacterium sp. TaxID=2173042 RepID=UPI0030F77AA2